MQYVFTAEKKIIKFEKNETAGNYLNNLQELVKFELKNSQDKINEMIINQVHDFKENNYSVRNTRPLFKDVILDEKAMVKNYTRMEGELFSIRYRLNC